MHPNREKEEKTNQQSDTRHVLTSRPLLSLEVGEESGAATTHLLARLALSCFLDRQNHERIALLSKLPGAQVLGKTGDV